MSENKKALTNKEIGIIATTTKLYPKADGTLEAIDEAQKTMFHTLIKKTGTEFDKMEALYRELVDLGNKLRNNPHLMFQLKY